VNENEGLPLIPSFTTVFTLGPLADHDPPPVQAPPTAVDPVTFGCPHGEVAPAVSLETSPEYVAVQK
jgi:hypothetical protein